MRGVVVYVPACDAGDLDSILRSDRAFFLSFFFNDLNESIFAS